MNYYLLIPPITFFVVLLLVLLQAHFLSKLSAKGSPAEGKNKAYACGEDVLDHRVQPDYSQFYSFAFFFTIMHVVVLVIATAPIDFSADAMAIFYILAAIVGLLILFRR